MSVSLVVGPTEQLLGSAEFVHSFFSTVAVRLEDGRWGSRFPAIMRDLYAGRLPKERLEAGLRELDVIERELGARPPAAVIWDAEDPTRRPPWGEAIDKRIHNLADYFVTSDGVRLLDVIRGSLGSGIERAEEVRIAP